VLLNTTGEIETGTLKLLDDNGSPLTVNSAGGTAGSEFRYAIPGSGAVRIQTDGSPSAARRGWALLSPDAGTATPVGAGLFGYSPGSYLVTESSMPAAPSTTHARIYLDLSGGHNTALAIANPTGSSAAVEVAAFRTDGASGMGTSLGALTLPAYGHDAKFADQLIAGLPAGFIGVLDLSAPAPFVPLTMRTLENERGDFIVATLPVADLTREAPAPIVFPHVADGGGYFTQFILIGTGRASNVTVNLCGEDGKPLRAGK
jgi:hypothetical protein